MPRLDAERIALWRAATHGFARVDRLLDRGLVDAVGLPLSWFEVLAAIRDHGGAVRVHELAALVDEIPSSLSRRLDRMEDDGFLIRRPTPRPDDRRAVTVTLTAAGRAAWREANTVFRRLLQERFARHLTDSDIAALHRLLAKLP